MAPHESLLNRAEHLRTETEIIISGISGRFPSSKDVTEFAHNMYNKKELITDNDSRWNPNPRISPVKTGKIPGITKFDAGFFGIHYRQAHFVDPLCRLMLEQALGAVFDAGFNPEELKGTKTGVYIACGLSESNRGWSSRYLQRFPLTGTLLTAIPNRISYALKLAGPSIIVDTGSSSSLYALELAFRAIQQGEIEMAIVGGCQLLLFPFMLNDLRKLGVLNGDGKTKCFDNEADGYSRSEAIACVFLQKASTSRRVYCRILGAIRNNSGYHTESFVHPSKLSIKMLLKEFYDNFSVERTNISFLEMHGTGTTRGDPVELNAVSEVLVQGRTDPLLIGSIKSLMGHAENASSLCAIIKTIIAMETGVYPGNVNYTKPNKKVNSLLDGHIKVVTENTAFKSDLGLVGVTALGLGGSNCHMLLQRNKKCKSSQKDKDDLPRLACVSSRVLQGVQLIVDHLTNNVPYHKEFIKMLHVLFSKDIPQFHFRGYTIVSKDGLLMKPRPTFCNKKNKLILVFSEFVSNSQLVKQFAQVPAFQMSFKKFEAAFLQHGKSKVNSEVWESLKVQIAIADVLKTLGIEPDICYGLGLGRVVSRYFKKVITLQDVASLVVHTVINGREKPDFRIRKKIGKDTIMLEIGNQLLQSSNNSNYLSFNNCDAMFLKLLNMLGQLYCSGYNFSLDKLYPEVVFPVSRGTPTISSLIEWNHQHEWFVPFYKDTVIENQCQEFEISLKDPEWSFVADHVIDNKIMFPETGFFKLVWTTFNNITNTSESDMQIVFENCNFLTPVVLDEHSATYLSVTIQIGNGNFEIMDLETVVCTGIIRKLIDMKQLKKDIPGTTSLQKPVIQGNDFYKEMSIRGYQYGKEFRKIVSCDKSRCHGLLMKSSNMITLLDSMIHATLFQQDTRELNLPTKLKLMIVDGKAHKKYLDSCSKYLSVHVDKKNDITRCGGIILKNCNFQPIHRHNINNKLVLSSYEFVPNTTSFFTLETCVEVLVQLVVENWSNPFIGIVELPYITNPELARLSPLISDALATIFMKQNFSIYDRLTQNNNSFVIGSNLLQNREIFNKISRGCNKDAFILSREPVFFDIASINTLNVVAVYTLPNEKLILIRNCHQNPLKFVMLPTNSHFAWVEHLQDVIQQDCDVVVVAHNSPMSGILGLVNSLRCEAINANVRAVFTFGEAPEFHINHPFYTDQLKKNLAINVYKNKQWGTYRHLQFSQETTVEREHCYLGPDLKWYEGNLSINTQVPEGSEIIYVHCSTDSFGFSGLTQKGCRVMGICSSASSTLAVANSSLMLMCPDFWTLEEAATVPTAYFTVYYAFFLVCKIKKFEEILIHGGSTDVGQAAIRIALGYGLNVYVTDDPRKLDFLKTTFPDLPDKNISDFHDTSFVKMIVKRTKNRGVHYVFNTSTRNNIQASIKCLMPEGHLIETKSTNKSTEINLSQQDITIDNITMDQILSLDLKYKKKLSEALQHDISIYIIKPFPYTALEMENTDSIVRCAKEETLMKKIVIHIRKETDAVDRKTFKALPRFIAAPNKVHVIIGGLGGFGLELANWLIGKGAKILVLNARKANLSESQIFRINYWRASGVSVHISTDDATSWQGCKNLILEANSFGPVQSIFNVAATLRDATFENQTMRFFEETAQPKVLITQHLDAITREMCPDLQHFVVFSSMSSGFGVPGQTNYAMANSVMERICEERVANGLPAVAIQWGPIADVGMVARHLEQKKKFYTGGTVPQNIVSCLNGLELLVMKAKPIVGNMVMGNRTKYNDVHSVVNDVAKLLGIRTLKNVGKYLELNQLGLDSLTVAELRQVLQNKYNLLLSLEQIRSLTFARLEKIDEEIRT